MKRVILPLTAAAVFILTSSSFAATSSEPSQAALAAEVSQLQAQTTQLQNELNQLQAKKKKAKAKKAKTTAAAPAKPAVTDPYAPPYHFVTVTTTPFMSKKLAYGGGDLLYNATSMNEDLWLLQQKQSLENLLHQQGYDTDRPILQISGDLEGQAFWQNGFGLTNNSVGTTDSGNGLALSNAEIDLNAIASSWATGFMALDYTNSPVSLGNREPIATLYVSRGFATIGNLNVSPIYFSIGLMNPPFGRYMTGMLSTPMTKSMGQILSPTAELGFGLNNGLNGSVFAYSGSQTTGGNFILEQGGANLGFKNTFDGSVGSYTLGAAWVSNIADSQGMQANGLPSSGTQFTGFGTPTATSPNNNGLAHRVAGLNAHGKLGLGPVTFYAEYIGAMQAFANQDMTFNTGGATPQAAHGEIDYTLPFFAKKYGSSIGVAYDHAWEALALNLPEDSYSAFFSTSIWRNTGESLEYRHNTNYSANDFATGAGGTTNIVGTGTDSNSVLAELDVYF